MFGFLRFEIGNEKSNDMHVRERSFAELTQYDQHEFAFAKVILKYCYYLPTSEP
jgi:hypothetical protein